MTADSYGRMIVDVLGLLPKARGPLAVFGCAWHHRHLLLRLTEREVEMQFRGSLLGKFWAAIVPLIMLGMYTFVFGIVLRVKWPGMEGGPLQVSLLYFAGLILFNFFFECVNRAPALLLENVPYIKKVIFPLEILPWVIVGAALFRVAISGVILLAFYLVIKGVPPLATLSLPLLILPLAIVALGLAWILSALGIFVRDIRQAMIVVAPAMMFLSPIFFPLSSVPEALRPVLYLNPLTFIVETVRDALFLGLWPNWLGLAAYTGLAWLLAWAGFAWFMSARRGFADVV